MKNYILIAGVNGTGKSSFRGVLEGQDINLGHIIDPDLIAKENKLNYIEAGKLAIQEIDYCLKHNLSFTQETTLSGHRIEKTITKAHEQDYTVTMYYIGLHSKEESIKRIENRVAKGGHNIPTKDVIRRYNNRFSSLRSIIPLCDKVVFYDNENGFAKVAEVKNNKFNYTNGLRPEWLSELKNELNL